MRGRRPTPTALKLLSGNPRRINKQEPTSPGVPECPDWMSKEAQAVWYEKVKQLTAMGVLGEIDGGMLTRYCVLWVRWVQVEKQLETDGWFIQSRRAKRKVTNPLVAISAELDRRLMRIETEFGMSPGSRPSLKTMPGKDSNPAETFMRYDTDMGDEKAASA